MPVWQLLTMAISLPSPPSALIVAGDHVQDLNDIVAGIGIDRRICSMKIRHETVSLPPVSSVLMSAGDVPL